MRIFTFYCVHGDAKEVEHLRCHHWLQLMRDVSLLGSGESSRTPAASFRVVYSAESRGQTGSSRKMNYDEFLNALMNVSSRACTPRNNKWQSGPSQEALKRLFVSYWWSTYCHMAADGTWCVGGADKNVVDS